MCRALSGAMYCLGRVMCCQGGRCFLGGLCVTLVGSNMLPQCGNVPHVK